MRTWKQPATCTRRACPGLWDSCARWRWSPRLPLRYVHVLLVCADLLCAVQAAQASGPAVLAGAGAGGFPWGAAAPVAAWCAVLQLFVLAQEGVNTDSSRHAISCPQDARGKLQQFIGQLRKLDVQHGGGLTAAADLLLLYACTEVGRCGPASSTAAAAGLLLLHAMTEVLRRWLWCLSPPCLDCAPRMTANPADAQPRWERPACSPTTLCLCPAQCWLAAELNYRRSMLLS